MKLCSRNTASGNENIVWVSQISDSFPFTPSDGMTVTDPMCAKSGDKAKMQVRRADGNLLRTDAEISPTGGAISDLLWVGSSLFFRDYTGVEVWTQTGRTSR